MIEKLNKTRLGIVYNLDTHNKPGSHWVSVSSNFLEPSIYYFDSDDVLKPGLFK